jgi:hypothetical protein
MVMGGVSFAWSRAASPRMGAWATYQHTLISHE